jgi:hypothetical protein
MPCTICTHSERQAIDLALLNRTGTLAQLSKQYNLSQSALHRHKQHLLKKMVQVQNHMQDMLREGCLFVLNKFLDMVQRAAQTADAEGNSRQLLQAVRQGTNIMKFMAKLDGPLSAATVHRLLASPQWAEAGSLLPTDPGFLAACHKALADSFFSPCPEPSDRDQDLAAGQLHEAARAERAEMNPEQLQDPLASMPQSLSVNGCGPHSAKREKGGKKAAQQHPGKNFNQLIQIDNEIKQHSGKSPGRPCENRQAERFHPRWLDGLAAGRLDIDTLNAIGAGRPQPELLEVFKADISF